jgi:hypothetical protein
MAHRVLSLAALTALLLPRDSTELYFEPEAGTVLVRTVELFGSFDLDDAEITVMGQTMGPEAMGGDLSKASAEANLSFEQTDTYGRCERGRALSLVRRLGIATFNGEPLSEDKAREVEFTWDGSLGRHVTGIPAGSENDPEDPEVGKMLKVLRAQVDPSFLLPTGPVDPGATWKVELGAQELIDLLVPGLDLKGLAQLSRELLEEEIAKQPADRDQQIELGRRLFEDLSGQLIADFRPVEANVTFAGLEPSAGGVLARLEFDFDLEFSFDPSEVILAAFKELEETQQLETLAIELNFSAEVSGSLLWDAAHHHSRELSLSGDYSVDIAGDAAISNEEMGELAFQGLIAFSGAMESTHTSAPPPPPTEAEALVPAGG